jgi:hypothetical protein
MAGTSRSTWSCELCPYRSAHVRFFSFPLLSSGFSIAQVNLDFIESTQPASIPPPTYGLNHSSNDEKTLIHNAATQQKEAEASGGSIDDYEGQVKVAEEDRLSAEVIDGDYEFGASPTEEEAKTLRKVSAPVRPFPYSTHPGWQLALLFHGVASNRWPGPSLLCVSSR